MAATPRHKRKRLGQTPSLFCGVGRDRTGDTRIFSPLLYRLSYRTILPQKRAAKIGNYELKRQKERKSFQKSSFSPFL
jgi:hypothetical protein